MAQSPPPPSPPATPAGPRRARRRRRDQPLRDLADLVLADLRRAGQFFDYDVVEARVMRHPQYRAAKRATRLFDRYGCSQSIRASIQTYEFKTTPYTGVRAIRPIPVVGRRQGLLKFADLMTVNEWQMVNARYRRSERAYGAKANDIDRIIADLQARIAAGQIGANGTLDDAYGGALQMGLA